MKKNVIIRYLMRSMEEYGQMLEHNNGFIG